MTNGTPVCGEGDHDHGQGGVRLAAWRHSPLTGCVTGVIQRMCHVFLDSTRLNQPASCLLHKCRMVNMFIRSPELNLNLIFLFIVC